MNFLARIGRSTILASNSSPFIVSGAAFGYLLYQTNAQSLYKKLYGAKSESGQELLFTPYMKSLIQTTVKDLGGKINNRWLRPEMYMEPAKVAWFVSWRSEPATLGISESKYGALIGIPYFYNFNGLEDIPNSDFELKTLRLFNWSFNRETSEKESPEDNRGKSFKKIGSFIQYTIERASDCGHEYAHSLILSDKAKKFAVARELFISDSQRVWVQTGLIAVAAMLGVAVGRVAKMKLAHAHVRRRISMYIVVTYLSIFNCKCLIEVCDHSYQVWADKQAVRLGPDYKEGAIELLEKSIARNKVVHKAVRDLRSTYTSAGDVRYGMFDLRRIGPNARLEVVRELELEG